jgi:hypothetical protein
MDWLFDGGIAMGDLKWNQLQRQQWREEAIPPDESGRHTANRMSDRWEKLATTFIGTGAYGKSWFRQRLITFDGCGFDDHGSCAKL